jgi:two-component system heavy metal sensor histidine kinase CusS
MPWQRAKRFFRSLRSRLTFWNTLVVLLAVIAALIGVREGLRFYLTQELDEVLDDEVNELLLVIREFYPDRDKIIDAMWRKSEGHEIHGWHIRWLDENRDQTIWVSEKNAPQRPLAQLISSVNGRNTYVSATHRSVERRLNAPGIPPYYVRVGSTTEFVERDIHRMTRIMAPVGIAIFLLAPLGGYFLANRAIDPLQKIISTTERLRPSHFEERLTTRGVDDELDQLAHKINQFLDQIADHLTKHREFLANAAHDLRSPLAAIQSSVEVTMQQARTAEEYQELLYSIDEECHHLGQLVNQLLDLAASDAGVVEPRHISVRLDELARQACEMFQAVAEERGLTLELEAPVPVTASGDPQQLRQLLTNLIDNAIKFTPRGGHVAVRLCQEPAQKKVRLSVQDSGIGISDQDLPRIFDRFYRADKSRQRGTDVQGSGLGLSICQSIVLGHHGSIDVQSKLGCGTTFTVLLPAG